MRKLIMILFSAISLSATGQIPYDSETKQILNDFFSKQIIIGKLFVAPSLDDITIDRLINTFESRYFDSMYINTDGQKTVFTLGQDEREIIKNALRWQKGKSWDSGVINNSFVYKSEKMPPGLTAEERLKYVEKQDNKTVISFSKPIFLRSNSLCVFFYGIGYMPLNDGGGEIVVLNKKGDKWEKFLIRVVYYV